MLSENLSTSPPRTLTIPIITFPKAINYLLAHSISSSLPFTRSITFLCILSPHFNDSSKHRSPPNDKERRCLRTDMNTGSGLARAP